MIRTTFRRLLAIDDPPERTALAFSIGVFIAFSPFLGLHTIMATAVAFIFRFNKIAIYTGTFINNPFLTLVPIIIVSYAAGAFLLGRPLSIPEEGLELLKNPQIFSGDYYRRLFVQSWNDIVWPFSVGAMALSIVCSLLAYPLTLRALRTYQRRKQTARINTDQISNSMKLFVFTLGAMILAASLASAQTVPQRQQTTFEVSEYGVDFRADPRLILVMTALEAAGHDPVPSGRTPSAFRAKLRKDLANLDPDLRGRLKNFYERNRLPAPATPAEQAARYVSLALALGTAPPFDPPQRSEDMPAGLLEVLDFAPLVQEFYRRSGIDERMVEYVRAYQAEGDRLRTPTTEMVRSLLTYLHTRPMTTTAERVEIKNPKKNSKEKYAFREKERRFLILPDLLAARGAINFRIIGDDYYAVVPEGTDPTSSELRRAYLQYVIDALVLRFNKDIAQRREQVKQILNERQKAGAQVSPDVFLSVSRSMVTAADARYEETRKIEAITRETRAAMAATKNEADRATLGKSAQAEIRAIQDETIARLAEEYEKGAVLSFYFADQLKGIEDTGFDLANFFPDMIASFDPVRESRRLTDNAEALQRGIAAREARIAARKSQAEMNVESSGREAALVRDLAAVEDTLRSKDYNGAEVRLREMLSEYPREPRIFFALGRTASLAATDATDENVRDERLNRALGHYRLAVAAASPETDKAIMSRAYESMGRINAFLENTAEAAKQFDEAIKIGDVRGGAYKEALEGKRKLSQP